MARSIKKTAGAFVLILMLCVCGSQLSGQDRIEESRKKLHFRGKTLPLGITQKQLIALLGRQPAGSTRTRWAWPGLTIEFDRAGRATAFEVAKPYQGRTEMRYGIGASLAQAAARDPQLKGAREGWNAGRRLFALVRGGRIAAIRIGAAPQGFVPRPTPKEKKPPEKRPGRKPAGGGLRPNPQPNPGKTKRPANTRPRQDKILVWQESWTAGRDRRWRSSPVNRWPTKTGILLVRVAYGEGVREFEQLFCDHDFARTQARDYLYRPDIVETKRKPGTPLSWQWRAKGRGSVKVKIIWFRTKDAAKAHTRKYPYRDFYRAAVPEDAWRRQVDLIWDHTWTADGSTRFVQGPKEKWPDSRGVLLMRAFAGPGVRSVLYRPGLGNAVEVPVGDHHIPVDIVDRAKRNSLFGGSSRNRLYFAARGRGPVKIMLYWLPERRYVDTWCREKPRRDLNPWQVTAQSNPFSWIFGGPSNWRDESRFESDWRTPIGTPAPTVVNVASRANGAFVRRSSRNGSASRGSEFDGGVWYSESGRWASSESRFGGLAYLDRVDIGTAGSDLREARFIVVELERADGTWDRIATFHDENINWCALTGNTQAVSRRSVSIPVNQRVAYRALRIVLSGRGPFRLGGIRAWGRYHGERLFEDPGVCPEPARLIPIAAAGGWTDTGGDVTAGRAVIIDIEGTWSLDADDNGPFGWCGPEGFAENALRGFFSSAAAFGAFRDRLPAPHLPAGALIARIGLQGRPVLVEPGRPMIFPESGHLWLGINDAERLGNRGTLSCTIVGAFFPHAGATSPAPDLVRIRCIGRITSAAIKRPVPGVDVFLQMEAWPRRIHGGARTDNEGRFDFEVLVPRGQNVVIGAPEFKLETTPRSYDTDGEFRVDFPIK